MDNNHLMEDIIMKNEENQQLTLSNQVPFNFTFLGKDGITEVGRFSIKDGKLDFTGDCTESAEFFIGYLKNLWNG